MPRTKKVTATMPKVTDMGPERNFNMKEHLLKLLDEEEKKALDALNAMTEEKLIQIEKVFTEWKRDIPDKLLNKTVAEIMNSDFENTLSSTFALASSTKSMNSTRVISQNKHQTTNSTVSSLEGHNLDKTRVISKSGRGLRSMSASGADEGYTTSESSRATNSGLSVTSTSRQSRSRVKATKKPVARSLSRNNRTPANRCPVPISAGSITPKCKTNVPLMWGRRPRIGEVGWSNQGSPLLLTGVLAPEQTATINIPMGNGDLVSLQPTCNTLKPSDLPPMEDDTKKELLILRDTLIKVCANMHK